MLLHIQLNLHLLQQYNPSNTLSISFLITTSISQIYLIVYLPSNEKIHIIKKSQIAKQPRIIKSYTNFSFLGLENSYQELPPPPPEPPPEKPPPPPLENPPEDSLGADDMELDTLLIVVCINELNL